MKISFLTGLMLTCFIFVAAGQASPHLHLKNGILYVSNVAKKAVQNPSHADWEKILSVYTDEAFRKKINQPVAGDYAWSGDTIVFRPAFSFASGRNYHAVLYPVCSSKTAEAYEGFVAASNIDLTFYIPEQNVLPTKVEAVYPQSDILPENLLRIYIEFSGPMMPGQAYDHIALFDAQGKKIDKAFLVVDQELWDAGRKRLTLLFDPGRIKRGLQSNLDLGAPLEEGKKYRLVIDSTWRDIHGNHLQNGLSKGFEVSLPQRARLVLKDLKLIPPVADSREALVVIFDRPMDHALVSKFIEIDHFELGSVKGKIAMTNDYTLQFTPDHLWQRGDHFITISPLLEDVAGNNFNNAFDLDVSRESRVNSTTPLKLAFSVKRIEQ